MNASRQNEQIPLQLLAKWSPVDWIITCYAFLTGLLIVVLSANIPEWPFLLFFRLVLVLTLVLLPARGSSWERPAAGESIIVWILRRSLAFVRYAYPLLAVLFFFEEVEYTVNALWSRNPYWFEPYLYGADRLIFGQIPAVALVNWTNLFLSEVMHAFYFSYYVILIGGLLTAWWNPTDQGFAPGPVFKTVVTGMTLAFFICFIHYPFLPARGPWENSDLMSRLPELPGWIFRFLIDSIIEQGAVSGGCFPSSHVAASWAIVFGLKERRPRTASCFGVLALGMSISCVYTRYHHAADVLVGAPIGLLGGFLGRKITKR